jgi:hypothetical protein
MKINYSIYNRFLIEVDTPTPHSLVFDLSNSEDTYDVTYSKIGRWFCIHLVSTMTSEELVEWCEDYAYYAIYKDIGVSTKASITRFCLGDKK